MLLLYCERCVRNKMNVKLLLLLLGAFMIPDLYGCGNDNLRMPQSEITAKEEKLKYEIDNLKSKDNLEEDVWELESYEPIDYITLKKNGYKILNGNVCVNPRSVYEDDWLVEQLKFELAMEKEGIKKYNMKESVIDYFLFDLDDDGVDEYIVSFSGSLWDGAAGNNVFILKKREEGDSDEIIHVVIQVYGYEYGYWPIAVLNEKKNGYYKIVFPWTDNKIWEYDDKNGRYDFSEIVN